jgi:DNA-binding SARP family transcriptional activator
MGGAYSSPPGLRIGTLGGLSLTLDGRPVDDLVSRRTEALLVYLACARRPQSREALADLLWDERAQTQAAGNFRVIVNSLRRSLGAFVEANRYSIGMNLASAFTLDVADFEASAQAALRDASKPDRALLFQAAGLYRGDFLAGLSLPEGRRFEEWVILERERLRRLQIEVLDALVDAAGRDRHHRAGVDLATRLLQIDPLRESTHRKLMRFHARLGERSSALAQYQACARVLKEELDVPPDSETRALAERIRLADQPRKIAPPQTPLVGRQAELAWLAERLGDPGCKLLTLAGIGGCGKTRLAIEAARSVASDFLSGAIFVPLAGAGTAEDLVNALIAALAVPHVARAEPRAQLHAWLRDKELLVVLDNVEQVSGAAAEIAALLEAAPELKLIVTSRQRLDLRSEWLLMLGGLPEADAETLFAQCAARAHPGVPVTPGSAARICRLVEGNPLAIEMAAAWVGENTLPGIADQIASSLDVLSTELARCAGTSSQPARGIRPVLAAAWSARTGRPGPSVGLQWRL